MIIIISLPAFSADWTDGTQIISAVIWKPTHKGFYVETKTFQDVTGPSCGTQNLYLIDPAVTEKEVNRLYSMILTAYATGDKVHVWMSGCDRTYVKFTGLQINK
jgi:hypothetical protein